MRGPSRQHFSGAVDQAQDRLQRGRLADTVAAEDGGDAASRDGRTRHPRPPAARRCAPRARRRRAPAGFMRRSRGRPLHSGFAMTAAGVSTGEQLAVVHDRDAVGEAEHDVHVVLDDEDRPAADRCRDSDHLVELGHVADDNARHRLVEQHDGRARSRGAPLSRACACRRGRVRCAATSARSASPTAARYRGAVRGRGVVAPRNSRTERLPPRRRWAASRTFSTHGQRGNRLDVWNVRPSPPRARRATAPVVTSRPSSSTAPAWDGSTPETRLNSVVLPAPLGPITPSSSPRPHGEGRRRRGSGHPRSAGRRGSEPPERRRLATEQPMHSVSSTCGRRGDVVGVETSASSGTQASPFLTSFDLVHRLDDARGRAARIVVSPFGPSKVQPSSDVDHGGRRRRRPPRWRCTIICAATKPSGENRSGCGAGRLDGVDHRLVSTSVLGRAGEVVVEELDLVGGGAVGVVGRGVTQTGDHCRRVSTPCWLRPSHMAPEVAPAQATKTRSGWASMHLPSERGELCGVLRRRARW